MKRPHYRAVYQYPDNGYPNANAIYCHEASTKRLARVQLTYWKRLLLRRPAHERGTMWLEQLTKQGWQKESKP